MIRLETTPMGFHQVVAWRGNTPPAPEPVDISVPLPPPTISGTLLTSDVGTRR